MPKKETLYIVVVDIEYYPYVALKTTDEKKAQEKYEELKQYISSVDTVYLCKVLAMHTMKVDKE